MAVVLPVTPVACACVVQLLAPATTPHGRGTGLVPGGGRKMDGTRVGTEMDREWVQMCRRFSNVHPARARTGWTIVQGYVQLRAEQYAGVQVLHHSGQAGGR